MFKKFEALFLQFKDEEIKPNPLRKIIKRYTEEIKDRYLSFKEYELKNL